VIQVFPDDFHLRTLEKILTTFPQLQPGVDVRAVLVSLVDRLANFATRSPTEIPDDIDVFDVLFTHTTKIIEQRQKMPLEDVLALGVSLLNLTLKCYPQSLANVDKVLNYSVEALKNSSGDDSNSPKVRAQVVKLLTLPLEAYKNILTALDLAFYSILMSFLDYNTRKKVAVDFAKNALQNFTRISESTHVTKLLDFISPLLKDEKDQPPCDPEDFKEEQNLVALLVHLFDNENPEKLHQLLLLAKNHLAPDEQAKKERIQFTLPPLVFRSFPLAQRILSEGSSDESIRTAKKIFKFIHDNVTFLAKKELPELALRLFLQAGLCANNCNFENIAYQFLTQAFVLYEDEISDSKSQFTAMSLIIGTLGSMTFSEEHYETLATKSAQFSVKLLKKTDQCRAINKCSHLFWKADFKEGKKVLECLQRSLKVAGLEGALEREIEIEMEIEILNEYLYHFEKKNEFVLATYINKLITLINTNIGSVESSQENEPQKFRQHYQNTLDYIRRKKEKDPSFQAIELE